MIDRIDVEVFYEKSDAHPYRKAESRPPRVISGGVLGVVYRGEVYPVYSVNGEYHIYLDDEPYSKTECPISDTERELQPRSSPSDTNAVAWRYPEDWYIESNNYGHYVVLDSRSLSFVKKLATSLEDDGFEVLRTDRSVRPADNGLQYDWFIRTSLDSDPEALHDFLEHFLDDRGEATGGNVIGSPSQSVPPPTSIAMLANEIGDFLAYYGEWDNAQGADPTDPVFLKATYDFVVQQDEEIERLELEFEELGKKYARQSESFDSLRKAIEQASKKFLDKRKSVTRAPTKSEVSATQPARSDELKALEAENKALRERIIELEKEQPTGNVQQGRRTTLKQFSDVLNTCFPTIAFDPDTPTTLYRRFPRLSPLLRVLIDLDKNQKVRMKRLQGHEGLEVPWHEVDQHISTGTGGRGRGRVYVRQSSIPNCHWDILIDHKDDDKHQARLVARLRKTPQYTERPSLDP